MLCNSEDERLASAVVMAGRLIRKNKKGKHVKTPYPTDSNTL